MKLGKTLCCRKTITIGTILLGLVLLLALNVLNQTWFSKWRLDLTSQKLYSLTQGTKNIVTKLEEPITLKFYFSRKLAKNNAFLLSYANRVRELLVQYQRLNPQQLKLLIIEPETFSEAEDLAVNDGLQGVPVDGEGNELYFGLVATNSTTGKQAIPFFQPKQESRLEYDISQLIYNISQKTKPVIGIVSAMDITGSDSGSDMYQGKASKPWVIYEQAKQQFEIKTLDYKNLASIPAEVSILWLINPIELAEAGAYAIDQFVLRGGKVLAFLDPYVEADVANSSMYEGVVEKPELKADAPLQKLLRAWGVTYQPDSVLAVKDLAKHVRYRQDGREVSGIFPLWMDFTSQAGSFNFEDPLVNGINQVTMASPGYFTKIKGASTEFVPLIHTTDQAMLIPATEVNKYRDEPAALMQKYKVEGKNKIVAARLIGPVTSAFPEGKPGALATEQQKSGSSLTSSAHLTSTEMANILLFADVDMLHDHFWVNVQKFMGNTVYVPVSGNGSLVLNALENLAGSNDLISVRNRGTFAREFTRLRDLELASQEKYRATELELIETWNAAKAQLAALEQADSQEDGSKSSSLAATMQSRQAEQKFRDEILVTRKKLREVRHNLNKDIESLQSYLQFLVIGFLPALVGVFGFGYFMWRRMQTK